MNQIKNRMTIVIISLIGRIWMALLLSAKRRGYLDKEHGKIALRKVEDAVSESIMAIEYGVRYGRR